MAGLLDIVDEAIAVVERDPATAQDVLDWEETPATFREFCESEEHWNFPLGDKQYEIVEDFVGSDGKKLFEKLLARPDTAVWLLGKGSGKDTMARHVAGYVVHVLLCLRNPRAFLGLEYGKGFVDVVNVAYNEKQAKDVYFASFEQHVLSWKWLKQKARIYKSGRLLSRPRDMHITATVSIRDDRIVFPKGVRTITAHSRNESYEGHDVLFWIMDEASAFKTTTEVANADKVYSTLKTSANSRFPGRWRGIIMSFPRAEGDTDFTMRMYEVALKTPHEYSAFRAYTWEVRPRSHFSPETFEFEGHQIPIDFKKDFDSNPTDAKSKYMCIPPKIQGAFFEYPERIDECINRERAPLFRTRETLVDVSTVSKNGRTPGRSRMLGREVSEWLMQGVGDLMQPRVAWADLGRSNDNAALVVARGERVLVEVTSDEGKVQQTVLNKLIEEAIVVWHPDKSQGLQVAITSVETLILDLMRRGLKIKAFGCDAWNSATLQESMKRQRVYTEEHYIDYEDYTLLQMMIYTGATDLLHHELQEYELKHLVRPADKKVDHPKDGSKDIADCLAGCARLLNGNLKNPAQALASMARRVVGVRAAHTSAGNASNNPFSPKAQGLPISVRDANIAALPQDLGSAPATRPDMFSVVQPKRTVGVSVGGGRSQGSPARFSGW